MDPNEVVYVGNVPKQATAAELADFFKDVGRVIKVSFMRENRNDCRTKIAFVLFENEMQALKACNFDQTIFQWNRVIVLPVNDERHFWAGHTVVVRNIAMETNEEDLFEAFGRYGTIEAVQIPTCNFAYIGFREKSAAVAAQRLHNTILGKNKISVQLTQRNMRVRLEDLDSFKTPRVYNELMDAKLKYDYDNDAVISEPDKTTTQQPIQIFDDYEDEEDNRVYDPITNRFYDKPQTSKPMQEPSFVEEIIVEDDDEDILVPPTVSWYKSEGTNESVDLVSPMRSPEPIDMGQDGEANDMEMSSVEIRRREIDFGKSAVTPIYKNAVRVENIPREVSDEDIVRYFVKFGLVTSVEIEQSPTCIFNTIYTVSYQHQSAAEKVLECFMRRCELSGVVCTIFTLRPDDIVQEVSGKCVIVDYISDSVVFEDVKDTFRHIGQVVYVKKTIRNATPSVVHFRHRISMDRAKQVTEIDGDKVRVVPYSQDAFRRFTMENSKLVEASLPCRSKPLKKVRLTDIEMKDEQERNKHMILRTVFNPNYQNPDPKNLTNEVVIYNCPVKTTLKDLRRHFISIAFVTHMRWEQSRFDTNTWKVYVSFCSFVDAFNAVRMKGALYSYPIFKHLATEKPKLDTRCTVQIDCEKDDISVTRMYNWLVGHGAITFVDKVDHCRFLVICRDFKTARKVANLKTLSKHSIKAALYQDVVNQQNAQNLPVSQREQRDQQRERRPEGSSRRNQPIPMDDLIALQKRIINDNYEKHHSPSRDEHRRKSPNRRSHNNDWERDFDRGDRRSPNYRRRSINMDIADDQPAPAVSSRRDDQEFLANFEEPRFDDPGYQNNYHRQQEENLFFTNPPAPNMLPLGGPPRDYIQGWAPGGPMYEPPSMVPPPVTRNVFIPQPPAPGTGILGGPLALRLPTITIHRIQPDAPSNPVPQQGDLREYLAEKRNTRPRDIYDPTEELDNSEQPVSTKEIDRIENYIREKQRQIQNRLHILDQKLTDVGGPPQSSQTVERERSFSPSDRKAHDRIKQIREEKVTVTRQLTQQLRMPNYRESPTFISLCERQSALDRECVDIQRQLEAKKLWLAERARSLSRERHEQEQAQPPARSKSRSRESRSRSLSRGRRRHSRSRSRSRRDWRSRRSRSSDRYHRYRSTSRDRARRRSRSNERGRRYNRRCEDTRRPESLMREMRQLGRPREGKSDHSVFVGNIAEGVRPEEMKATFARYGRLVECDFSLLEKYGEIYFDYHQREDAFGALEMNRVKFNGKRLRVALNCRKPANRDGYSVIVELSEPVPERDLYARFDSCGEIEFIWHHEDATIATITFERPESMLKALAIRELHNRIPIIVREYVESER